MSTKASHAKSNGHATHADAPASEEGTPVPSVAAAPVVFIPAPPVLNLPAIPAGFTPAAPGEYRTVAPRASELAALPQAIIDLKNFTDYAQVIGTNAPTIDEVLQAFAIASQWSEMRTASEKWDQYCLLQEGLSWQGVRSVAARLLPAYTLAIATNPVLPSKFTGLTAMLNAKKTIAQRAASTRRANREAIAQGMAPSHGKAAQRAQRVAAKALLKATQAAGKGAASSSATPASAGGATAPAKPATVTPVTAPGATVANGATPS